MDNLGLKQIVRSSSLSILNKDKVYSGDSSEITDLPPPTNSAELGRVTVNTYDREQVMTDKCKVRLGSGTKIDELKKPLKICIIFF